jgi:hypothetical protein
MRESGDERALSEVIGFVLLLALFVTALSLWMMYVVPVNGREDEITQMNYVRDSFTQYKFSVDEIWHSTMVYNLSPVMTSTSFTLGTGGGNTAASGVFLSFLKPIASSATISILNTTDTFDIDSSSYHGSAADTGEFPLNMTGLEYRSSNNYWIQQRYVYQLGGVFLYQEYGSTARVSPLISIVKAANNSVIVQVVPVQLIGGGSMGGNGPVRVDTRQISPGTKYNIYSDPYFANAWVNLSVSTADNTTALLWQNIFTDIVLREGLDSAAYSIQKVYDTTSKRTTVYILITGVNPSDTWNDVSLYVTRADFYVTFNNIASVLT